jgi:4-cresol dehydrogenase (hydroxylating)
MRPATDIHAALAAWAEALGMEAVLIDARSIAAYALDTTPLTRQIPAILKPASTEAVMAVVRIAARYGIPIYPVSTGHNWGYGTANPIVDGCVLVDLSGMNRIHEVEAETETGLVTVEPGVTQRQLREFLDRRDLRYFVPVTGAGPDCSLLGNALERGYGITPFADHFGALTWLEAVLPDGSIYRGSLSALGAEGVDKAFKWGLGPYLDGMFTQGAFGIVTRVCIALAPIPARTEAFFFNLHHDSDLEPAVEAIKDVLAAVGSVGGSINLMNDRRVLAMIEPYPKRDVPAGGVMSSVLVQDRAMRYRISPWTGVGALYGEKVMVDAAKRLVRQRLRHKAKQLFFMTPGMARRAHNVLSRLPGGGGRLGRVMDKLDRTLRLLSGEPSEIALPLAYSRSGKIPTDRGMDPARDGCGLIWYSPLVPMSAKRVRVYVEMVKQVCVEHGIEPLITLTSISSRCFDSTVPILFDRADEAAAARADACYRALFDAGRREGFLPYRMGAQYMDLVTSEDSTYWRLVAKMKHAIDPDGIISPGRYCPVSHE